MQALAGSGMSCMSDSWIAFQPAIEEPSNMMPSLKVSSSNVVMSVVTCCHLPRGSVNRKSTYLMSLSLTSFITSLAVVMACVPFSRACARWRRAPGENCATSGLDGVKSGFPSPDPDGCLNVEDEDFAFADPPGLGG